MAESRKATKAQVRPWLEATFPDYDGRKFRVELADKITLYDLHWSGGTRNEYRTCTLEGRPVGGTDEYAAMAPWNDPAEGKTFPIPVGFVVAEHSIFMGKDMGITFTLNSRSLIED